jgi:hypothetical protein
MPFEWIPGRGIDGDAVERMKQHFPQPTKPTYEAWFISGTINYHHWLFQPFEALSSRDLAEYLFDTGSGITSFGRYEEWVVWFQYLLPRLLPRFWEENLLTLMLDYVFNLYPDGLVEEYSGFRDDIMRTLPQAIMSPELWKDGDLALFPFYGNYGSDRYSPIYASMFFCLMYLSTQEIVSWVASLACIEGEFWQEGLSTWLKGAQHFFEFCEHPERVPAFVKGREQRMDERDKGTVEWFLEAAQIDWWDSHFVFTGLHSKRQIFDYLPAENVETFWREVKKQSILARMLV